MPRILGKCEMTKRIPWNKKDKVNKICTFCKKLYFVKEYRRYTSRFCSYSCGGKARIFTEETRKKISLANKGTRVSVGRKVSLETRRKMSDAQLGEKSHYWQGGKIEVVCKCGKVFDVYKYRVPGANGSVSCSRSCAKRGIKLSIETRKKQSDAHKGEKSYLWKGGITPFNKAERVKFQHGMQKLVFQRDDYTCQLCGIKGVDLQVDHIQSWAEYVELRFSMDNCRTLCAKCHYKITFRKPMPKEIKGWGHHSFKGGQYN